MQKQTSGLYIIGRYIYNKPILFFFLFAVIAYWPISFFLFSLQYDMIDVTLPWRYFAGECLQNNTLPLWNPFQQCGYPIHADLQYPVWYPEVYLIGFTFGYTNITLHILYITYIALAGLGMYKLAKVLSINHHYALITGGVFMLCGIFVGHAQSLVSILGATWLPWVIAYYIRLINSEFRFSNILKLTLFTFLMLTGGYQAVSFMLLYLLIALFLYKIISFFLAGNYQKLKQLILSNLLFASFIFILCFGMIISIYYVFPYIDRLAGLSYEGSYKSAFTPQSLISLLSPFAAITNTEFFNTDISITNGFIGVIILIAGLIGIFRKKSGFMTIILILGGIFLFASFGKYTPVQKLLYSYVPLMNLFRFPCFYRYFAILAILLSAGYFFTHHIEEDKLYKNKKFLWLLSLVLFAYALSIIISATKINFEDFTYLQNQKHIIERFRLANIFENIFIQGIIQLAITGLFLFLILHKKHLNKWLIFVFVLVELSIAVQLNLPVTGYGLAKPLEIKEKFNHFPKGSPIPDNVAINKNSDRENASGVLWRNLGNYNKQVSADAFTSFMFSGWMSLIDSFPSFRDSILNNELLYLSDDIRSLNAIGEAEFSKETLYLPDSIRTNFSKQKYSKDRSDKVIISSFQPNEIVCSVSLKNPQWLTLIQNDYIGWQVYIDGKKAAHYTSNLALISLPVPSGKHEIVFSFELDIVKNSYILSIIAFLLLLLLIYYYRLRESNSVLISISLTLIISSLLLVLFLLIKNKRNKDTLNKQLLNEALFTEKQAEIPDGTLSILSWDDIYLIEEQDTSDNISYYKCQNIRTENVAELSHILSESENKYIYYSRRNTIENPAALGLIKYLYPESDIILSDRKFTQLFFNKSLAGNYIHPNFFNAEKNIGNWSFNAKIDSSRFYSSPASYYIDSNCIYGISLVLHGKDLIKKKNRLLTFNGRILWEKPLSSFLVIHIIRDGRTMLYKAENLLVYKSLEDNWFVFSHAIWLSDYIRSDDEIKIYIWNPHKAVLWMDELQVEVF